MTESIDDMPLQARPQAYVYLSTANSSSRLCHVTVALFSRSEQIQHYHPFLDLSSLQTTLCNSLLRSSSSKSTLHSSLLLHWIAMCKLLLVSPRSGLSIDIGFIWTYKTHGKLRYSVHSNYFHILQHISSPRWCRNVLRIWRHISFILTTYFLAQSKEVHLHYCTMTATAMNPYSAVYCIVNCTTISL